MTNDTQSEREFHKHASYHNLAAHRAWQASRTQTPPAQENMGVRHDADNRLKGTLMPQTIIGSIPVLPPASAVMGERPILPTRGGMNLCPLPGEFCEVSGANSDYNGEWKYTKCKLIAYSPCMTFAWFQVRGCWPFQEKVINCDFKLSALSTPPASTVMGEDVRKALEFYADELSYIPTQMKEPRTAVHGDNGRMARAALSSATPPKGDSNAS